MPHGFSLKRLFSAAAFGLVVVSFLLPVGDGPWTSFWREWLVAIATLAIVVGMVNVLRDIDVPLRIDVLSLPAAALVLAAICYVQLAIGMLSAGSDAILPSLYFVGFALCFVVAQALPTEARERFADKLALAMLMAALLSSPLAVLQWTGWLRLDLGLPVEGGRPVAHMEQPNLLCSLLIQGLIAAWRLAERGRVKALTYAAVCIPLLATVVLTQSRVALLVGAILMLVLAWRRSIVRWTPHGRIALGTFAVLVSGAVLLPWVDTQLGLHGAALAERASVGRRPDAWFLFLDAVQQRPWLGWGVLQNGEAQFAMAPHHVSLAWYFSSAHDIVIDLVLWFGVPIGLASSAALGLALVRRVASAPDGATLATAFAAVALVLHGLVELPLYYAYFLLPLGFYLGLTTPPAQGARYLIELPSKAKLTIPLLAVLPSLALALLAQDYIALTNVRPVLAREETTRTWILSADSPVPQARVLDLLRDYHAFAALPLKSDLSRDELQLARRVMLRRPVSASMERYALLAGLSGDEAEVRETLRRLCKLSSAEACSNSKDKWSSWRRQWIQLPAWPAD